MKQLTFLVVVDESKEMDVALYYACRCAERTKGRVGLFYAIEPEPPEFAPWHTVEQKIRQENFQNAERRLSRYAAEIDRMTQTPPLFYIREGARQTELSALMQSESSISAIILATGNYPHGPGPLISYLTRPGLSELKIPLIIVPGDISRERIDRII